MDNRCLVSVITVCFNSERYLERSINSVLCQVYPDIEYIIIDGGSTDNTLNIIKKYENRVTYWITEKDNGIFDAMNKGINIAKGDIVLFLNSDDYIADKYVVEKAINLFKKIKKADFIYGNTKVYDPISDKIWLKKYPSFITKSYLVTNSIGHQATFFKANCFKIAGGYDLSFKIASDREWFLRALYKYKLKPCRVNLAISVFQLGGISNDLAYRKQQIAEVNRINKMYFSYFNILIATFLDLLCSGSMFRKIAAFLLGSKGYDLLKRTKNRFFKCIC